MAIEIERAFPIVIVGHVDHGKSTLIGRLLHDTGSLPEGKFQEIEAVSKKRGMPIEWSFALDSLQLERDQAITVDSTQIWFKTKKRPYVIIDAPGHREFLRNMVTGAAQAEAAVIVIDASQGVSEQTRRHAFLLHLLGLRQVIVAINKMDLVGFSAETFNTVGTEMRRYLDELGLTTVTIIPVSARNGDNLATVSAEMPWWKGGALVDALDALPPRAAPTNRALRLPVQDVYRRDNTRIIVGRIESGRLKVGDRVSFWPTGRSARIKQFLSWSANGSPPMVAAGTGQSVAFTLDDDLFIERGHLAAQETAGPALSDSIDVRIFWLARQPLTVGKVLTMKLATASYQVTVEAITRVIDVADLSRSAGEAVEQNGIADITLRGRTPIAHDLFHDNAAVGRVVLADGYDVVGGGIIQGGSAAQYSTRHLTAVPQSVSADERAQVNRYRGAVVWMSGLSGAGKSTLAMALQRDLFRRGLQAYVLDGDNVRSGLNRDLGFEPGDRTENLRRVAEVCKLFADAGLVVISAFISPTDSDRRMAREIIGDRFHEVFVDADLKTCEARDVKGLYSKARQGLINDFTGISAPWEPPKDAQLTIDTAASSLDESLLRLSTYVLDVVRITGDSAKVLSSGKAKN